VNAPPIARPGQPQPAISNANPAQPNPAVQPAQEKKKHGFWSKLFGKKDKDKTDPDSAPPPPDSQ
jgi:hypothetical protein